MVIFDYLLFPPELTVVSPTATLTSLHDRSVHPYFLSTGFHNQEATAEVLMAVARKLGWDLVSLVYTNTSVLFPSLYFSVIFMSLPHLFFDIFLALYVSSFSLFFFHVYFVSSPFCGFK